MTFSNHKFGSRLLPVCFGIWWTKVRPLASISRVRCARDYNDEFRTSSI